MASQVSADRAIVVSSGGAMVIEDDQPCSRSFCPPTSQSYQTTVVEACRNQHLYSSIHERLSLLVEATTWRAIPFDHFPFLQKKFCRVSSERVYASSAAASSPRNPSSPSRLAEGLSNLHSHTLYVGRRSVGNPVWPESAASLPACHVAVSRPT